MGYADAASTTKAQHAEVLPELHHAAELLASSMGPAGKSWGGGLHAPAWPHRSLLCRRAVHGCIPHRVRSLASHAASIQPCWLVLAPRRAHAGADKLLLNEASQVVVSGAGDVLISALLSAGGSSGSSSALASMILKMVHVSTCLHASGVMWCV